MALPRFATLPEVAHFLRTDPADPRRWGPGENDRSNFLDRNTMRYFDSRLTNTLHTAPGDSHTFSALAVISNRYRDLRDPALDGPRFYRVIQVGIHQNAATGKHTARVDYVGDAEYPTAAQAHRAAADMLNGK